jgi:RNA polymerase sigma factor (sigma-70 family)
MQKIEPAGEGRAVESVSAETGDRRLGEHDLAARKRAAVETYAQSQAILRRTARRYSICGDDADDALQRSFEILLRKAPTDDQHQLIKWMQTVVKHEALAIRRERERTLAGPAAANDPDASDWVSRLPAAADGPLEQTERREEIGRSREALRSLKPQELRALTLLAQGYSYVEIGEITGYSQTKINRCLAEGRERFRRFFARSEAGERCQELAPLISSFCDGELAGEEVSKLREHLRACAHCRATLRTYRAAPATAAALAPALPFGRSLLLRAQEALHNAAARFGLNGGGESGVSQAAGSSGIGAAGVVKVAAICLGTAGSAGACLATGLVPLPTAPHRPTDSSRIERSAEQPPAAETRVTYEPAPAPVEEAQPQPHPVREEAPDPEPQPVDAPESSESGAVVYQPPPPPEPSAPAHTASETTGSPAGEFGP